MNLREKNNMKFFRMDSDLPNWEVWDKIRKEHGMNFHICFSVYMILYARLADNYNDPEQSKITISETSLRKTCRISQVNLRKTLGILEVNLGFTYEKAKDNLIFYYPNFLKKQRLQKRYGSGKFK